MRIIITFDKKEKIKYTQNQLQGLVYYFIKKANYSGIHELPQKVPRFFNFSQLFLNKSDNLTLIIASPIKGLIKAIKQSLKKDDFVRIADQFLQIIEIKAFDEKIDKNKIIRIKTETPIIVRIPKEKYKNYLLPENFYKYPYFYWRPQPGVALEPFVKQLEARIYKQYKIFTNQKAIKETPIFFNFRYLKTVDLPFFYRGNKYSRPGTLWKFEINPNLPIKLIKFILDVGLGELNSQGYGFVNIEK